MAAVIYQFATATAGTYQLCSTYASTCGSTYAPFYGAGYVQLAPGSAQTDTSTNTALFINKTAGTSLVNLQASGSTVFNVQTNGTAYLGGDSASAAFMVDTTSFRVKVGTGTPSQSGGTNNATTGLYVSGTTELAGLVFIGTAANNASFSNATKEVTFNGTARHARTLRLIAEYAGAVLDTGGASTVNGIMTASFDAAASPTMSYYKWTTSQATNQSYDVVVTVPVPEDWGAWNGNATIVNYGSGTGVSESVTVYDTANAIDTNINTSALTVAGAWSTRTLPAYAGTYTAGGVMKLRIHMVSGAGGDVRLGTISLPYLSKW